MRWNSPSSAPILRRSSRRRQALVDALDPRARGVLEPQGRWPEFLEAFADLVHRFNLATARTVAISSEYLLITVDR